MPKKKELLIILILAVLVAAFNYYCFKIQGFYNTRTFPMQAFSAVVRRADPNPPSVLCVEEKGRLICPTVYSRPLFYWMVIILDLLFWFLVLAGGWRGLSSVLKIRNKKRGI